MGSLDETLAEIEKRAAHLSKDPRARWFTPKPVRVNMHERVRPDEVTDLYKLVSEADIPRLIAGLKEAINNLDRVYKVFLPNGHDMLIVEERIASILVGGAK